MLQKKPQFGPEFIQYYRKFPRLEAIWDEITNRLSKSMPARGFQYPAKAVYFRAFKDDEILELWLLKNDNTFGLWDTYKICAISGSLGPKRREGDRQIPEGFYEIERFNPMSRHHLSLGINYPNQSDKILGDPKEPGTDIFLHGGCVTVGCIPIGDALMEEPFVLAIQARGHGQLSNPFHIFPTQLTPRTLAALDERFADEKLSSFWKNLSIGYRLFEENKIPPNPWVNPITGAYIFD